MKKFVRVIALVLMFIMVGVSTVSADIDLFEELIIKQFSTFYGEDYVTEDVVEQKDEYLLEKNAILMMDENGAKWMVVKDETVYSWSVEPDEAAGTIYLTNIIMVDTGYFDAITVVTRKEDGELQIETLAYEDLEDYLGLFVYFYNSYWVSLNYCNKTISEIYMDVAEDTFKKWEKGYFK